MKRGERIRRWLPTGRRTSHLGPLLAFVLSGSADACRGADEPVDYLKQIKPVLRERCYACHGALKQEAGLRLDTAALAVKGGAIKPGDTTASLLLHRVTAAEESGRMPPEGEPLKAEQIAALKRWIVGGAKAPADERPERDPREHWAFKTPVRPPVPKVANANWVRNPIDAFLADQHQARKLVPQPEASRAVLLRRLYLDLIGLPPSLADLTAFENDRSPDWYERVVDRLLDDPRHGERWARHWMDVWRYSDWWGLGNELRNSQKHIWHWRDWLVESLNGDTPYDEMVRQMLAADELYPTDLKKLRATGYLARNWFLFNRHQWLDETVEHVAKGFLGLTMNCAKCHDHKFDPVSQVDYYKLRAFFEPYHVRTDVVPGEADLSRDGIPRVFDGLPDAPTYRFVRGDERNPDTSAVIPPGVPELFAFKKLVVRPVTLPPEAWQPERRPWVADAYLAAARTKLESASRGVAAAKEKLAAAERRVPETAPPPRPARNAAPSKLTATVAQPDRNRRKPSESRQEAAASVAAARGELRVAELAVQLAVCELSSLELRIAALRATWAKSGDAAEKVAAAVRSEREVAVAKARHAVAEVELRLAGAAADKRDVVGKELKGVRESLANATRAVSAAVGTADTVSPLPGTKWTPTRFQFSGKDDPVVVGEKSSGRRKALAEWVTDRRNPLTARVAVNHLWARHFGTPLVPTVFDFGRNGAPPANPALLDWLASELVEKGWGMKHLHRLVVTSAAYRMRSSPAGGEANMATDPDNRHWWRRTAIRLESQAVRDSILALAGELDPTRGGPPVPPAGQADSKRRSLYFFHSNNERNLFLTTFDEASVKECYRRDQTIVPQQALALANSRLVLDRVGTIAARVGAGIPRDDDAAFVRCAFRGVLGVPPAGDELAACVETMKAWRSLPDTTPDQARGHLIWVLINHNDFVTLR
jgi:hypothetical protein